MFQPREGAPLGLLFMAAVNLAVYNMVDSCQFIGNHCSLNALGGGSPADFPLTWHFSCAFSEKCRWGFALPFD